MAQTFYKVFGVKKDAFIEVVNLNETSTQRNSLQTEFKEATLEEEASGGYGEGVSSANLSSIKIVSVVFDVEGSDEGNERVVLENSGAYSVSLTGASIQYLPVGSDFSKLKKRNFDAWSVISPGGKFVIGMNCHESSPCVNVDMSWSEALNNSGGSVFIVSNEEKIDGYSDSDITSRYDYNS